MAGSKVNNYSQIDSNILELQLTTDKTFKGYHQLTLTNYDNTTVPAIAAGSAIECNGALYKFDTEEAISTTDPVTSSTVADGTVYVCIVPGATTATAAFTATAPTWSDSKQGWYGTGGQVNYRYAQYCMNKASTAYTGKTRMFRHNFDTFYYAADATERTTTSSSQVDETNMAVTIPIKKGCMYEVILRFATKYVSVPGTIYFGKTTTGNIRYLNNDYYFDHSSSAYLMLSDSTPGQISVPTTSYVYYSRVIKFLALATESYNYCMSWKRSITTGTWIQLKDRYLYVREIMGSIL